MEGLQMQQTFFQNIKAQMPANLSFVDEIADILQISNDSAYRRIRGEKSISLDELQKLAQHFKMSVDKMLHISSDYGTFTGKYIQEATFNFSEYLQRMVTDLSYINSFKEKQIIFFSKDIPVFHYLGFPELAAFKYFFWMKTILQFSKFSNTPFSFDILMKDIMLTGAKVISTYNSIPSAEIMSIENINTTLRQIQYYKETFQFASMAELDLLYVKLHEMADHIALQAEKGYKFLPGTTGDVSPGVYQLYVNDFIIGDNSNIVTVDNNKLSFIIHAHVNYMIINDRSFTAYHESFVQNIIRKSSLISGVGEKYRARFFYLIHEKIEQCRRNEMQMIGTL